MRFVKGVVDSADLPLNVSRETLQHNPLLAKIKSNLVNRVIKTLEEMKTSEYETYVKFFREFGAYIKEGAATDWSNRERLADLLLVESTKTEPGKFTTLADYVSRMPSDQKEIFYLIGESRELIANSPYVEAFKAKGQEVLLLTDPVDEYLVSSLSTYKDKQLKAADRGEVESEKSEEKKAKAEQFKPLLDALKVQAARSEGRTCFQPAEGKRGGAGGRRGGDGSTHGTAPQADGPGRRGAQQQTVAGNQSRTSRSPGFAQAGNPRMQKTPAWKTLAGCFMTRR